MKLLIDTNWAPFIADLPTEKQLEFFWAVFDYGNRECSLKCWDMIQPILEKGKIGYYNKLRTLKHVSDKIIDTTTDTIIDTSIDTTPDTTVVSESVSVNNNKHSRNNGCNLSTTRTRVKEFTPPTLEQVLDYAKQQNDIAGIGGFACTPELAEQFWAHYESIGWRVGNESRTPILNWQTKLRYWAAKDKQAPPSRTETEKERKARENHEKIERMLKGEQI